jgi:hypothetical protein
MASRKSPARRSAPKSDRITDEDVEAAVDIIRKDYWQDVRWIGDDLKEQVKRGEITNTEEFEERLLQEVDGSARVIYTFQNKLGLLASNNPDAYVEEFGEAPVVDNEINWAAMMNMALLADVRGYLGDDISFDD